MAPLSSVATGPCMDKIAGRHLVNPGLHRGGICKYYDRTASPGRESRRRDSWCPRRHRDAIPQAGRTSAPDKRVVAPALSLPTALLAMDVAQVVVAVLGRTFDFPPTILREMLPPARTLLQRALPTAVAPHAAHAAPGRAVHRVHVLVAAGRMGRAASPAALDVALRGPVELRERPALAAVLGLQGAAAGLVVVRVAVSAGRRAVRRLVPALRAVGARVLVAGPRVVYEPLRLVREHGPDVGPAQAPPAGALV